MDFEKLNVWKESKQLAVELYLHFQTSRYYSFKDLITRSGLSVPSNVADKIAGANFERDCTASKVSRMGSANKECPAAQVEINVIF